MLTSLTNKALGALWGKVKWKIAIAVAVAVVGYVGVLKYQLNSAKADLRVAEAELTAAQDANASLAVSVVSLETANSEWARLDGLSKERQAALKKDAENAKRNAERARSELERLRQLDRGAPDCAALLDRSLAACPDLVRRLWPEAARPD